MGFDGGSPQGPEDGALRWLSTKDASARMGVTLRSLYRFIDEGLLPAYRFGRVIRVKQSDVDSYIESCRIRPGSLEHLYPDTKGSSAMKAPSPASVASRTRPALGIAGTVPVGAVFSERIDLR